MKTRGSTNHELIKGTTLFFEEPEEAGSLEIVPTYTHPLRPSDIRKLEMDETSALEIKLEANGAIIDGKPQIGRTQLKAKISFNRQTTIYALVQGGWLPLMFATPARFLVDRNVVISLRKIREGKVAANVQAIKGARLTIKRTTPSNGVEHPIPLLMRPLNV